MRKFTFAIPTIAIAIQLINAGDASAAQMAGQVTDAVTGNPVPDATVETLRYTNAGPISTEGAPMLHATTSTDMAGRFSLTAVEGAYDISVSHIAYETAIVQAFTGEFADVELAPASRALRDVIVTAGRNSVSDAAGALTNVESDLVQMLNGVQEPPEIATEIPNATFFGWGGLSIGPTHLKIRGFDSNRLSISVNGVPANDPEDHNVYWQNTPDLLSNTYDIQVERGVSDFGSAPAGVGGGLNLATGDAVSKRLLMLQFQAGKFNTLRRTMLFRSGLVDGKYNFTGRFSRVSTDGYRDHSAADMWSYFLSAAYFGKAATTRLQVYGGEEVTDLAFNAVDQYTIAENREFNPAAHYGLNYDGEKDHFQQPHYVLLQTVKLSPALDLNYSLFWIHGFGYYEQYKAERSYFEYSLDGNDDGLVNDADKDFKTDLIRRKYVEKDQIGWMPRLNWEISPSSAAELGLEIRGYASDHYGRIVWGNNLPAGTGPDYEWYKWKSEKSYAGGFFNFEHQLSPRLRVNAGVELRRIGYSVDQAPIGAFKGYQYDVDYTFVNPRLGLSFQPRDHTNLYASIAMAGREPTDEQVLNADNPLDVPKLPEYWLPEYEWEEVKPERMLGIEAGVRRSFERMRAGVNVYAMFFTDEIISTGRWDNLIEELTVTNAPTSRHLGVEFEAERRGLAKNLDIQASLGLDFSTYGSFQYAYDVDTDWKAIYSSLDGNTIALTPTMVGNLRATYRIRGGYLSINAHRVGKQFLTGMENDALALDSYTLIGAVAGVTVWQFGSAGGLDIELRGINLIDSEYETFGWVEVWGPGRLEPMVVPAAGRHYLAGVTLRL